MSHSLTLAAARRLFTERGWTVRDMDGRHEVWTSPDGRRVTLARSGKGGRTSPAPHYVRAALRRSA